MKAQYGILRFKKYKGPAISPIEAHNERTKEQYASNPDIDTNRSRYNLHLVQPQGRYREEADRMIAAAHCRVRKDSVRVVEALVTASQTGREHIPPRIFKEMTQLTKQKEQLDALLVGITPSTARAVQRRSARCLTSIVRQTIERRMIGRMSMLDEWSALATFLADMIEKYADVLEVDKVETASRISDVKVPAQKSENPQISVENVTAA